MSQRGGSPERASASEKPRSGNDDDDDNRSILVSNIPHTLSDDKVMIHFQRRSSGGGDVRQVRRLSPSQAKVIFEDVKVVRRVVSREHDLDGMTLQVEAWSSFLVRALEMDRARHREPNQNVTLSIHQPVTRPVWDVYKQKIARSKPNVTLKKSANNDVVSFKGIWNDVIEARNLLLCDIETDAKSPSSLDSNKSGSRNGQADEGVTNSLEHLQLEDASYITPAGDSQHQLRAAVNNGTENPTEDQPPEMVHLDRKQGEGASNTRPYEEKEQKSGASRHSSTSSQMTKDGQTWDDDVAGFTHSQRPETREENGLKEETEFGRQASFQQSTSAPGGTSSAYGTSRMGAVGPHQGRKEKNHGGASSGRSTTQVTKIDQSRIENIATFARSQSSETREENLLREARGDGRNMTSLQRSVSDDGASSVYGTSSTAAEGPRWDGKHHSPATLNPSSKHSSESNKQGAAASDISMSSPGKYETKSPDPTMALGGSEAMAHQQLGPPQDKTSPSSTYKLPEEGEDEAMTEIVLDQTVEPDIMSYIIKVHSPEINMIARKHRVSFDHSKDNSTVYIKGSKMKARAALEDFITLYQTLFSKLHSRSLDTCLHNIKAGECVDAVQLAQDSHPSIHFKTVDGVITFIGEEQEIRAARATICGLLNISETRRRRGNPSGNVSSVSSILNVQTNSQPEWYDLSTSDRAQFREKTTGVQINIVRGDITTQNVDVIVNAANHSLTLIVGVSGAISRAGGRDIQSECDNYIIKHGNLKTTDCIWTTPGRLPCKSIIHAVGPNFVPGRESKCKQELYDTCQKALVTAASRLNAKSIAMPAISSGMSGMPRRLCAEAMCNAIMDFVENNKGTGSSLLEIRIVDNDREAIKAFCDVFRAKIAKDSSSSGATGYSTSGNMAAKYPPSSPNYGSTSHNASGSEAYPGPTQTYLAASYSSYPHGNATTPSYPHPAQNYSGGGLSNTYPGASRAQPSQSLSSLGQKHLTTSQNNASFASPGVASSSSSASGNSDKEDTCPICLCDFTGPVTTTSCKHKFCADCLDSAMKVSGQCPVCKSVIGRLKGNQPLGTMTHHIDYLNTLPGYEYCRSTIEIHYYFSDGIQGAEHPNPGKPYTGTSRRAYLPNNVEGNEVLRLLKKAFDSHLVFTIGTSVTTGQTDTVVWNDIHHKTSKYGGPNSYGYPDPQYLTRVKEELAAKGIK